MNRTLLVSPEEAAAELGGVSRGTVYAMLARNDLDSIKLGRRRLITRQSIEAFIQRELERGTAA